MALQSDTAVPHIDTSAVAAEPLLVGRSKALYRYGEDQVLVRLIPSLSSFTYARHERVAGTETLRLDFYELAARRLDHAGIPTCFQGRVAPDCYLAEECESPPFEVIVKNVACGSTLRKYPGLFEEGHRFQRPVVKFDYRIDPEDQPISPEYVREAGFDPVVMHDMALATNVVLRSWLCPRDLLDFCLIIGRNDDGEYKIISEISPDCMRLRDTDGGSLDKDIFRRGASHEEILTTWSQLVRSLAPG